MSCSTDVDMHVHTYSGRSHKTLKYTSRTQLQALPTEVETRQPVISCPQRFKFLTSDSLSSRVFPFMMASVSCTMLMLTSLRATAAYTATGQVADAEQQTVAPSRRTSHTEQLR
jgi:hypothetical protein